MKIASSLLLQKVRKQTKARGFKGERRGEGMPVQWITELEAQNSNRKLCCSEKPGENQAEAKPVLNR